VEHFCVEFNNPGCIGFVDIMRKIRRTQRHTE